MKTVALPKGSGAVKAIFDRAREEDVIVRAEDGTKFVVRAIDEFGREIEAQRRNKKLMAFLDRASQATEWIPLAEVEKNLGLPPRRAKRKRP